ncbi:hypothetical protein, partial [Thiothrix nivea]|uniref:hypothetical protein n=1 Tax=Thiothrix nivea TaxID=1031 RepID=UPI001FE05EEA
YNCPATGAARPHCRVDIPDHQAIRQGQLQAIARPGVCPRLRRADSHETGGSGNTGRLPSPGRLARRTA